MMFFVLFFVEAQLYRIRQEHLPVSLTDPKFVLHPGFTSTDQKEHVFYCMIQMQFKLHMW
jgi:hypothetical protein